MRTFGVFLLATALFAGLAIAQDVTVDDISICKSALQRLMPDVNIKAGFTVFCPTNDAFEDFAVEMGYEGDQSDAEAFLNRSPAHLNLFRTILSYHIAQGVTPLAKLSSGPVSTLSGHSFEVVKEGNDDVELKHTWVDLEHEEPEADEEDYTDAVEGGDLTFEGPYQEGVSTYVVHAVEAVMVPKELAAEARAAHAAIEAAAAEEFDSDDVEVVHSEEAAAGKAHRRLLHSL